MKIHQLIDEGKKGVKAPKHTVKPRNFVAKNAIATTSGAGAHKDKKKALKQGDVKHKGQEFAESAGREMTNTPRDRLISKMSASTDPNALMQKVAKVVNSPEFTSDTILQIVDAGNTVTHPVGRYIQKEFDELQYDLGRQYEDYPEEVAEKLLSMLIDRTSQNVDEATTNPDLMSATDYDRYQQGQMDSEKRNFKRDELESELGHEDRGMYWVLIAKNGKWEHTKAQPRQEGMNAAQRVIDSLHAKYPSMHLGMMGPDGKVYNMGKGG
jgi:hypothetical protein